MEHIIHILGNNKRFSWIYRAQGELLMLVPPISNEFTSEAMVALTESERLLAELCAALPSENLDKALIEVKASRALFDEGRFVEAHQRYENVRINLFTGGIKSVTCVIRVIDGRSYFVWDFPEAGETFYTFQGLPHILQIISGLYLIWVLVEPNKIKVRTQS